MKTYKLMIDDVLQSQYANLDGIELDTHATVWLRRKGLDGPIEALDTETRSTHLVQIDDKGMVHTFEVKLKSDMQRRLVAEIERLAIKQAENLMSWEPEDE